MQNQTKTKQNKTKKTNKQTNKQTKQNIVNSEKTKQSLGIS